jgi:protein SCO1/2
VTGIRRRRPGLIAFAAAAGLTAAACSRSEPPRQYPLEGQVLSVQTDRQAITIRHQDIAGFMPGMTMTFPVTKPELLAGREPGELIKATLEVTGTTGRLIAIERVGFAALPETTNAAMLGGSLLDVGATLPDAALIDQSDRRRSLSEWRNHVVLMTFTYTRCPIATFCPLMDRHFARLQTRIAAEKQLKERVRLITISFDPEHDTPAVLASHAQTLGADPSIWTFLTGDRATIDRVAAALGVGLVREADGTVTHNLRTILVGADHRILKIFSGNGWSPDKALVEIEVAARF